LEWKWKWMCKVLAGNGVGVKHPVIAEYDTDITSNTGGSVF